MRICRIRFWNFINASSSTRRKHCAVRSLVTYNHQSIKSINKTHLILQIPHTIAMSEFVGDHTALGQNSALETAHVKEQIGIVLRVDRHKRRRPFDRRQRARHSILDVPKYRPAYSTQSSINQQSINKPTKIDIVLHESHSRVSRPALLVVVPDDVLIVRIGMLRQIALNQISRLVRRESEEYPHSINVALVESNRMRALRLHVLQ